MTAHVTLGSPETAFAAEGMTAQVGDGIFQNLFAEAVNGNAS
jgi:hypothetical protein